MLVYAVDIGQEFTLGNRGIKNVFPKFGNLFSTILFNRIDILIIGALFATKELIIYSLTMSFVNMVLLFIRSTVDIFLPSIYKY